jgi:hypothetical protein
MLLVIEREVKIIIEARGSCQLEKSLSIGAST